MAGSKGLEGLRSNGTDLGGPGYIHPRSDKYRDNFDGIFRKPSESGPKFKCEGGCEDCNCENGLDCCGVKTGR